MPNACPHCGRPLPAVVDAFCPDCRRPLDEPPRVAGRPGSTGRVRARSVFGLLVAAGGLFGIWASVSAVLLGRVADAVYTGVVGLAMLLAGLRMSAPPRQEEGEA